MVTDAGSFQSVSQASIACRQLLMFDDGTARRAHRMGRVLITGPTRDVYVMPWRVSEYSAWWNRRFRRKLRGHLLAGHL
jgi:hypothetical protein